MCLFVDGPDTTDEIPADGCQDGDVRFWQSAVLPNAQEPDDQWSQERESTVGVVVL